MKKYLVIFAMGAAVLASCTKESLVEPQAAKTVITVGIADTKTTIGDPVEGKRSVYWANGDKIQANDLVSAALTDVPEQSKEAQFVFDGVLSAPVNFLYPASLYKDAATITVPATQSLTTKLPLYGHTESLAGTAMHPLMSVLSISLVAGADADQVKTVQLSSATQALSGDFAINYETGALTAAGAAADNALTVIVNSVLSSEPTSILVAVPAGSYDLQVKIKDEQGHCMTKTISGKTFVAGQYVNMPTLTFTPTTTEVDIEIATAEEWNTFAAKVNEDIDAYAECVASITADLDFEGKDVVTIGDYPTAQYFSGAILGNNHVVKNLVSSNYLVACVNTTGLMQDLSFDESCSFTVSYVAGQQKHFGPFTEYVKGTVKNCHNHAAITLKGIDGVTPENDIFVGGVVGRIREGEVVDCSNSAKITLESSYVSTKYVYAGGICGYASNADAKIVNCTNTGEIESSAYATQVYAGGIVGQLSGTADSCVNDAMFSSSIARPASDACKHLGFGGIAGKLKAGSQVANCTNTNKGNFVFATGIKLLYAGGIAAVVDGTVARLEGNTSAGSIVSTAAARQFIFGGLFGRIDAANNFTFEGEPFTGSISISGYESATSVFFFVGGLVGHITDEVTIQAPEGEKCTIADNIIISGSEAKTVARMCVGGVVGSAGETGANASNYVPAASNTLVTIKNFTTSGDVKLDGSTIAMSVTYSAFGGIIGGAYSGAVIDNCSTSANVYFGTANYAKNNGKVNHLGGIAGEIEGANSSITNCTSSAKPYSYQYNNNTWSGFTGDTRGCIIGAFGYRAGNTAEILIENCQTSGTCYGYRGISGGIAGFVDHATVKGCEFTGSISRGAPAAGIAAVATNSAFLDCTVKTSKAIAGNGAGSCTAHVGGVIGEANSCSVDGTKVFSTLTMAGTAGVAGAVIGSPDAACTIGATSACAFGGSVAGTAVTADNYATLAVGNKEMTPAAITYWDGN